MTTPPPPVFRLLPGLCFALSLLAASNPALAVDPPASAASLPGSRPADGLEGITALIGAAECDHSGQCRAVGIGAKPCGGPSGYLAWSSKQTDPSALAAAVGAHSQQQKEEAQNRGLVSDCRVLPEPTAVCRPRAADGRKTCQLGQGGVRSAV